MDDAFTMLERYGARLNFYSDMGINLILMARAKQNLALCKNILSAGITNNTVDCPNALHVLRPVIAQIFQKGRINEYEVFKKYFECKEVKRFEDFEDFEELIGMYPAKTNDLVETNVWRNLVKQPLIHSVIEGKDLKFCQILIRDDFHVNSRDNSGNFPVHVAARVGDSVIIGQLIKNKAKINTKNHENQVPLHLATKNGHKEVFDILMSCDADDFRDNFGKTAEDYARENGHYDKFYVEYMSLYS